MCMCWGPRWRCAMGMAGASERRERKAILMATDETENDLSGEWVIEVGVTAYDGSGQYVGSHPIINKVNRYGVGSITGQHLTKAEVERFAALLTDAMKTDRYGRIG